MTIWRSALPVAATILLAGCTTRLVNFHDYRGDGTFTPQPAPSIVCRDGYTVDLGAVDLTAPGQITRRLEGLPSIEAALGFAMSLASPSGSDGDATYLRRPAALIELTLRDERGHIVLSRHEQLSEWTLNVAADDTRHAYLYRRGTQVEVPVAPGVVRVERFPIGQDESWGTHFVPRRGARYALHFAVEEPDANLAGIEIRLQVNGVAGCL